jgi:hypothetical protein
MVKKFNPENGTCWKLQKRKEAVFRLQGNSLPVRDQEPVVGKIDGKKIQP